MGRLAQTLGLTITFFPTWNTMDAYLIVGEANTRKSSVLRSLTGCFNRSNRDILLTNGKKLAIYARVASLQESKTTPTAFIIEALATGQSTVIFCLWPGPNPLNPTSFPDAAAYVQAFQQAGWLFKAGAVLGGTPYRPATPRVANFSQVPLQPINVAASAVRSHFRWQ